ncbi:MAG: septum formation initiator [Flavobacteriaceae bacterium]|nr:septum formation initiator [Flavobacteriaceae bacterium]|tara:strand:- start:17670 stop:17975 length:306 start_codon:yes stop_codon:yes gene_type:complete
MGLKKILSKIRKRIYVVTFLVFLIWMLFLDTHSMKIHMELNEEINDLEIEKKELKKLIAEDESNINQLMTIDSLERFAREKYGHKREEETIFYIEFKDSIN